MFLWESFFGFLVTVGRNLLLSGLGPFGLLGRVLVWSPGLSAEATPSDYVRPGIWYGEVGLLARKTKLNQRSLKHLKETL